jgi:hypothetical protein
MGCCVCVNPAGRPRSLGDEDQTVDLGQNGIGRKPKVDDRPRNGNPRSSRGPRTFLPISRTSCVTAGLQMRDVPFCLQDFVDRHEGRYHTSSFLFLFGSSERWLFQRKKPVAICTKAPCPGFVEPALASSIEKAPSERWIHEIKFHGYRVQVHLANTEVRGRWSSARRILKS